MRRLLPILFAVCFLSLGCLPRQQQLAAQGVQAAVASNNKMVDALTAIQAKARKMRKAMMVKVARTVSSLEEGNRKLDEIDKGYVEIFEIFRTAEDIQVSLAAMLEAAQVAVNAGEDPDMSKLIALYVELQDLYNAMLIALSEVE